MIIVGIDSGATGGVAFIGERTASVFDMPVRAVRVGEKLRNKLDAHQLAKLLRANCPADESAVVYLEQLHARAEQGNSGKRNGMQSQGAMMEMFGGICATLDILRMQVVPVYPISWKRFYALDSSKTAAREMATRLYGGLAYDFRRVKDDGRAEAILIAHYGRRKHCGAPPPIAQPVVQGELLGVAA
ncbi:crossover junction endodeoxyribonuclease RuvC [Variovorax boronicumulans]|uniref:hypothetical protein n=1 Tax=Variovorax boronicumulans TaxID=436515 RepID=UPI00278B9A08|nr:hypothetical protein [Variovorax boronicumulans]MDQ0035862.1 crossover junction endodeoxyribonuclease RuvC [Variovorax boronicumulans]